MQTSAARRWRGLGLIVAGALTLAGCGRLDQLTYQPATTPEQWCQQRPCVEVGDTVWTEPLGSFLVFTLAALWVAAGIYFLATRRGQRSRAWLGVALVLGGIGAAQAGISYQAFSYVLKCEGRELCVLTNGFEVGYSVTQALSVSAMLTAVAFACAAAGLRRGLIWYAGINAAVYVVVSIAGVLLPSAVLLSFSVLMLFALPGIVIVIVVAARRYRQTRDPMDRSLVVAAVLLVAVQIAYFGYYAAGITATLYDGGRGFYFSENDVLHVGMILWLGYVVFVVGKHLRDNVVASE
ncbi:MAG TPA: hypothetical protein PLB21_02760 [Actinomycetota bacterium]|mgnify:CR=1 FL=1|nr:hypothetical protein [Actinomycetota bacterium]